MAPLSSGRILAEAFVKDNVPCPIEQYKRLPARLPDLAESRRLCYIAIEEALPCHECIDRDTFFTQLKKIEVLPFKYTNDPTGRPVQPRHAHTRLSIGVATALRIGLHVPNPPPGPGLETSPERVFRRRQVFSLLYAIDTYLASTLGMPKLIRQVDTCQILPLRDEDMHDRGISFVRKGPYTPEAETLVACQILVILAEIHARRDPFSKSLMLNSDSGTYELMSHEVSSLDKQLNMWYNSLPPVDDIPPVKRALHAQLVIRLTYAITQMSLHRPFLHHLTRRADDCNFRMDGYAQGSQCITAVMQSVWLLQRLDIQGFLHESIWFYISSLAFAASSLVYFVLGSPYSTTVQDARDAALKAHGLLAKLGRENEAAQQCFVSIDRLMAQANLKVHGHS
ncbi:zn2/cys6 DNA-binding protein [Fusarium flagelliforme]|uniref:Zn2/cys6 DNA-binding protein n=1 Tax=Fusarium flagelliforme TaxID=2675880 RepID=A0A395MXG5_9HYPO|nr:zn2/cys6 DNA-binding protein [Fusarium flagelliforme]